MSEQEKPEGNNAGAQPAQVRMTVSITRKATGQTETHELVGHVTHDEPKEQPEKED